MMALARQMHAESRYAHLNYDDAKVFALGNVALTEPSMCIFVAEERGAIVGMLVAFVQEYYFGNDLQSADIMFYVHPDHRGGSSAVKLVKRYEQWALERGVKPDSISIGVSAGITDQRAGSFLEHMGYKNVATLYVKEA